jgi:regulatory protein
MFGRRARSLSDGESLPPVNLRAKAIGFLARREHSRAELLGKLGRFSADKVAIETLLDALTSENLLSERRAAQSIVRARSDRQGAMRVAGELRARGISGELAQEVLRDLSETEAGRARALWERKFGAAAVDAQSRARQMRFLQARGFSTDVIRAVVPAMAPPGRSDELVSD